MRVEWKGGNLTKKRAAFLCWQMWQWIAGTLTQEKWNEVGLNIDFIKNRWPEWDDNGGMVHWCAQDCMACEQCNGCCAKCIMIPAWGKRKQCCSKGSPYEELWQLKTAKAVRRRAQIIADGAKKVYEGCR